MTAHVESRTVAQVAVPAWVPAPPRPAKLLRPTHERFAQLYAAHGNAAKAYRQAFPVKPESRPATIRQMAYALLAKPHIAARVRELLAIAAEGTMVSVRARMVHLQTIVEADPSELVRIVAECCRYCHGTGHAYQWIDANEYAQALRVAAMANRLRQNVKRPEQPLPSDAGGYGFDPRREPHEVCPRCHGEASVRVVATPSDQLSAAARKLLKGVQQKASGEIEVRLHDKLEAVDLLNRMQGVYVDRSVSVTAHMAVPPVKDWTREEQLSFLESLRPAT